MAFNTVTFIGAGNMSKAIINGMVSNGYPASNIMATNPSQAKLNALKDSFAIATSNDNLDALEFADVIVLSVKPQIMGVVLNELITHPNYQDKLYISVAAGINVSRLQEMLLADVRIVRVMPNTPCAIGQGMSGLYASEQALPSDKAITEQIMKPTGEIIWLDDESKIDGVIAAAGSSPAYFFLFLEAMQDKAIELGFTPEQSRLMVQQAMRGAADLVCHNPTLSLSELRQQVTSKGGTTAQAISHFQENMLEKIVADAMQAAVNRAREMSEQI